MTTATRLLPPGAPEFERLFATFRHSVYRLETLQSYAGSGEDEALSAFMNGQPEPPDPEKDDWVATIRDNVRSGKTVQRVHVVREPLSDYLRFELTWAYEPNDAAGEDIRIIPLRSGDPWVADLPTFDYWLFDARDLYRLHYDQDGTWRGIEHITDPHQIVAACYARDAALHLGIPWKSYIRQQPDLMRHLSHTH